MIGLHANKFDAELSVPPPSQHGEIDRQRCMRVVEPDLDPEVLRFRRGVGRSNPAPFVGNIDERSGVSNRVAAEIHLEGGRKA